MEFGRFLEYHNLYGTPECECFVVPSIPDEELIDFSSKNDWNTFWSNERARAKPVDEDDEEQWNKHWFDLYHYLLAEPGRIYLRATTLDEMFDSYWVKRYGKKQEANKLGVPFEAFPADWRLSSYWLQQFIDLSKQIRDEQQQQLVVKKEVKKVVEQKDRPRKTASKVVWRCG